MVEMPLQIYNLMLLWWIEFLLLIIAVQIGMIVYGVSLILMKNDFVQYVLGNIVLRKRGDTGDA
jgi:hypothetical protein